MDTKQMAKELFNETWDLIDVRERSREQDCLMLHKAHASCYLWSLEGQMINNARGEWQVSHVYSVLSQGAAALLHAEYSLDICLKNNIAGLDLAFGYEAVARAYALLGKRELTEQYKQRALAACEHIEKQEDRDYATGEINAIKTAQDT
jgi:hypothetical protein